MHSGRIVIGVKNEAVELWRGWNANNRDNHLYTWNSMLLGNVLRASGFVIDRITSPPRKQLEASLVENGFGTKRHSFQYLWAYAHKPRPSAEARRSAWAASTEAARATPTAS